MNTKILESLGFTPKEIDVYLAILVMKRAPVSSVMAKANVSRKSIYEILQKLLDKGLVSQIITGNKKHYEPANPERLLDVVAEEREILKEKETDVEALLPELLKRYKDTESETKIELFAGKNGMKAALGKILKVGKLYYVIANEGKIFEFLKYHMPQFIKQQEKLKIQGRIIYDESVRGKITQIPGDDVRYISNKYAPPTSIEIYGDNVNILVFSKNPVAIHIKGKEIAESYMQYFSLMWSMAKK